MTVSFIASTSQVLWRILDARGIDPAPVFRGAGLDPRRWNEPDARFPDAALDRAWADAIELTEDPCIGLEAARFLNPASLHALGFAWLASDTLFDALSRLVRYSRMISDGITLELTVASDECRLVAETVALQSQALPARVDSFFAGLLAMSRQIASQTLVPKRVMLRHAAPDCASRYAALFGAPVDFGATRDAIGFPRDQAERPLPTGNHLLARQNDQVIDDYLQRFDADTLTDRVRTRLLDLMPSGRVSEGEVASGLHLSPRTLQRRLADEGTSFKVVLDEARQALATRYIGDNRLSIKETSYLLGFSEPGNFSRAFKRWTGRTPSQYRDDCMAIT
jgi:AraC-like DNA-binding protein